MQTGAFYSSPGTGAVDGKGCTGDLAIVKLRLILVSGKALT